MTLNYLPFDESLPIGESKETDVGRILGDSGAFVCMRGGRERQDLEVIHGGHVHRVEVKNEDKKASTNNICVELFQRNNRRSNILVSEAQIFIHTFCDKSAIFRRRDMQLWCLARYTSLGAHAERDRLFEEKKSTGFNPKSIPDADRVYMMPTGDNGNFSIIAPLVVFDKCSWFELIDTDKIALSRLWTY